VLLNAAAEHTDLMVECFQGIKTEQLHRVIEKRRLFCPETVIIPIGTIDLRTTRKIDFVLGELYALLATEKRKLRTADLS